MHRNLTGKRCDYNNFLTRLTERSTHLSRISGGHFITGLDQERSEQLEQLQRDVSINLVTLERLQERPQSRHQHFHSDNPLHVT